MRYMVPYSLLRRGLGANGTGSGSALSEEEIMLLTRRLLRAVDVDEDWYRKTYPDVAVAIDNGSFRSAKHHFVSSGYFEGRLPFPHEIDEEWYMRNYPDIAERYEQGEIPSLIQHYSIHGYREGRLPGDI